MNDADTQSITITCRLAGNIVGPWCRAAQILRIFGLRRKWCHACQHIFARICGARASTGLPDSRRSPLAARGR